MSKRILFISDLHLQESRPDITDAFLGFLESNKSDCTELYILGDLFELWIGDDNKTALSDLVAEALYSFHKSGAKISILHGNRDFLLGSDYIQRCAASLIEDSHIVDSDLGPILVLHGDSLCTDDVEYLQFRKLVRQDKWQQEFLEKTLSERKAFAEQARQQSQKATSNKDNAIMDVNSSAVEQLLTESNQTLMIHGHTHRPQIHVLNLNRLKDKEARRVVLGDWDKNGWFAEVTENGLRLEKFPL